MKSPFPGMDPYLERHWGDVHQRLITYAAEALNEGLPADLAARMEERVFIETELERGRQIVPDAHIAIVPPWPGAEHVEAGTAAVSVAEPIVFDLALDPITEGYLEIRDLAGGKVITVIEFLSPANKRTGSGQDKYLQKQEEVPRSDASLVEIDLVRAGKRVLALPASDIPAEHQNDFLACISPVWRKGRREFYPLNLRRALPAIPVPLRKGEQRLNLNLQALIDRAYVTGRYQLTDYKAPPEPPLLRTDEEWADQLLKAAGRR